MPSETFNEVIESLRSELDKVKKELSNEQKRAEDAMFLYEDMQKQLFTALDILRLIEWSGADGTCPSCGRSSVQRHDTDCMIALFLAVPTQGKRRRQH